MSMLACSTHTPAALNTPPRLHPTPPQLGAQAVQMAGLQPGEEVRMRWVHLRRSLSAVSALGSRAVRAGCSPRPVLMPSFDAICYPPHLFVHPTGWSTTGGAATPGLSTWVAPAAAAAATPAARRPRCRRPSSRRRRSPRRRWVLAGGALGFPCGRGSPAGAAPCVAAASRCAHTHPHAPTPHNLRARAARRWMRRAC